MIKPETFYTCTCDNCGEGYGSLDVDNLVMPDESSMRGLLGDDYDWYTLKGKGSEQDKHYCPDCWSLDDNDKLILKPQD